MKKKKKKAKDLHRKYHIQNILTKDLYPIYKELLQLTNRAINAKKNAGKRLRKQDG